MMNNMEGINEFESKYGFIIPNQYKELLRTCNGVSFDDGITLYALEDLRERNADLQIQKYIKSYIAIGDDSGGLVFLMKQESDAHEVICVDISDYDVESPFFKVNNFDAWYRDGCNIPAEDRNDEFSKVGNIYLVKAPANGIKDLVKIKKIFGLNISMAELLKLSKDLPNKLIGGIKYAKAIKLIEKTDQPEMFEFGEIQDEFLSK